MHGMLIKNLGVYSITFLEEIITGNLITYMFPKYFYSLLIFIKNVSQANVKCWPQGSQNIYITQHSGLNLVAGTEIIFCCLRHAMASYLICKCKGCYSGLVVFNNI